MSTFGNPIVASPNLLPSMADVFSTSTAYSAGQYVYYGGKLYQFTANHAAGAWVGTDATAVKLANDVSNLKSAISDLDTAVDNLEATKADKGSDDPEAAVGTAEQVMSDAGVTDKVPYLFRKSAGDGANRERDSIVGGTVAWNQLLQKSTFSYTGGDCTTDADGVATFTASASGQQAYRSVTCYATHVILVSITFKTTTASSYVRMRAFANDVASIATTSWQTGYSMYKPPNSGNQTVGVIDRRESGWDAITIDPPMVFDLTQMFGSTIADYIYTLESTEAGAGVALFRSLFPAPYYAYNTGELKSVTGLSAHVMRGFNQWDGEYEKATINWTTYIFTPNASGRWSSKNYIPVIPDTAYYITHTSNNVVCGYTDNQGNGGRALTVSSHLFTVPSDVHFIKFGINETAQPTDVCINISNAALNGTYEPYDGHSYPLDSDLTLRGIPKLDASNNLYYDGDTYAADGTVTRKYAIVDLGSLSWSTTSSGNHYAGIDNPQKLGNAVIAHAVCGRYVASSPSGYGSIDKAFAIGMNGTNSVYIHDSTYDNVDAATFKTAMSGVYLVYELATPTTESADPYNPIQIVDPNGTEEYVSTGIVPVGHDTFYPENVAAKIAGLPWNFANLIAYTESGFTASKAYSANDFLIINNQLYKATTSIANGATITVGTNVTATTIGEQITAILNS